MSFVQIQDPYGLAQGISTFGSALGQALQQANTRRFDKEQQEALFRQQSNLAQDQAMRQQELEQLKGRQQKELEGVKFGHTQKLAQEDFERKQKQNTILGETLKNIRDELGEDASFQDKAFTLLSSNISPEMQKAGLGLLKQEEASKFAEKFANNNYTTADIVKGTALEYISPGVGQDLLKMKNNVPKEFQTQQLANFYGIDSTLVEGMEPTQVYNIGKEQHERNQKFDEKIVEEIEQSFTRRNAVQELRNNIASGAFDPGSAGNIANVLEDAKHPILARIFRAFESPESAAAQASLKELMSGIREIVPARGINVYIEKMFREMLPLMGRSREANLAALKVFEDMLSVKDIKSEIRDEILQQSGGKLPFDYEQQMRNRLIKEGKERVNNIVNELESFHSSYGTKEKNYDMNEMPSASENAGKTIEDDKGNSYRSDGTKWRKI